MQCNRILTNQIYRQIYQTYLNKKHPTIKLEITFSTSITFLDTKIYKNENETLCTSIYKKSSDRLPYIQALRIKQICSKSSEITKHLKDLNDAFNWRGY